MNVVQKKKKWVGYHDNLQEEVLVTLHYFLVLLNSPTGHRPFEGCGWQPWAVSEIAVGATFLPPHNLLLSQEDLCDGWLIAEAEYSNSWWVCVNSLCEIQPVARVVDGCMGLLAKPKPLHGNTSHKTQKVSKDLGLLGGLLPAVSSLDKENLSVWRPAVIMKLRKAFYRYKVTKQVSCLMA